MCFQIQPAHTTHTCAHIHAHHTYTHTYTHVCIHTCAHTHTCVQHTYPYTHVHTYTTHAHMYIPHTHTHAHTMHMCTHTHRIRTAGAAVPRICFVGPEPENMTRATSTREQIHISPKFCSEEGGTGGCICPVSTCLISLPPASPRLTGVILLTFRKLCHVNVVPDMEPRTVPVSLREGRNVPSVLTVHICWS